MDTVRIPLARGKFVIIDEQDAELIADYDWGAQAGVTGICYAKSTGQPRLFMHRLILGFPEDGDIDHIGGDGLNNTRANLRVTTHARNMANRGLPRNNTSGFKGVSFHRNKGRWQAELCPQSRRNKLGYFATAEEAARHYDDAVRKALGEFGRYNFPRDGERGVR